jgi:hypothetical protein
LIAIDLIPRNEFIEKQSKLWYIFSLGIEAFMFSACESILNYIE